MKTEKQEFHSALLKAGVLVLLMWAVFLVDLFGSLHLNALGVEPRSLRGLRGILFSPFLHGGWEHIIANSIPILVLGTALFYFFQRLAGELLAWQWFINGILLWCIGRENTLHIGASGLVYSLAFFLLFSGFVRRNKSLAVISFIVIILYGSLVWGLFPLDPSVSWEGHFSGFLSGLVLALFFRKQGPADDQKKVWDDSDLDGVEPYWEENTDESVSEDARPIIFRYHFRKKSE